MTEPDFFHQCLKQFFRYAFLLNHRYFTIEREVFPNPSQTSSITAIDWSELSNRVF